MLSHMPVSGKLHTIRYTPSDTHNLMHTIRYTPKRFTHRMPFFGYQFIIDRISYGRGQNSLQVIDYTPHLQHKTGFLVLHLKFHEVTVDHIAVLR